MLNKGLEGSCIFNLLPKNSTTLKIALFNLYNKSKQNVLTFIQRIQQHLPLLEAKLPHLMPAQLMLPQQQLLMERARLP
jgi:hypothetical protein